MSNQSLLEKMYYLRNEEIDKIAIKNSKAFEKEEQFKRFLASKIDDKELLNQISMEFENYEFEMIEEYQNYGKIAYIFATLDFQCLDETIKKELKEFYEKYDIGGFKYYEQ